jgi:hypothetical protein
MMLSVQACGCTSRVCLLPNRKQAPRMLMDFSEKWCAGFGAAGNAVPNEEEATTGNRDYRD